MDSPATPIFIKVLLFSSLREAVGVAELDIGLEPGATGSELLAKLEEDWGQLRPFRRIIRLAINSEYVPELTRLQDGDEVALITPVSGG